MVIGMAMIDLPDEGSVELVQNTTLGWQVSGGARAHAGLEWVPPGSRESEIQRGENPPRPQGSSLLVEGGELGGTAEQLLRGSGL